MSWVRIEDAVTEHRKHLQAGPAACWLWVCGIAYCQRQLSDGFIPDLAVPLLGVPKGTKGLVARLVTAGLFERVVGGYLVHDYHDYNDSREQAIVRREAFKEQRRQAGLASASQRARSKLVERPGNGAVDSSLNPIPSHPDLKKQPAAVAPAKPPPDPRVREFLTWFQEEYRRRRNGADYLVSWAKHGAIVKELLHATDLDRLKKYAQILLSDKTDDEFIVATDRGIEVLRAKFSWLSDRLAAWETRQRPVPA